MGRVLVALSALLLTACVAPAAEPEAQPGTARSSSPAPARPTPTERPSPKLAPPAVRLARAVAALRRSEPLQYQYILEDSHVPVIRSLGSWDPGAPSASLFVLISKRTDLAERLQGNLIAIGDVWYGEVRNHCWIRLDRADLARRYGLTEHTIGLTAGVALTGAQVTGVSPGSKDVLEVSFELGRVLAMAGVSDVDAGTRRVPGQVTVLDGRVTKWTVEGADLAESLAGVVSPRRGQDLSLLALEMAYTHGPTDGIRRPPSDELEPNCQARDNRPA